MNSREANEAAGVTEKKEPAENRSLVVHDDGPFASYLDTGLCTQIQRVANVFAQSDLIPPSFQKNNGSCFIITQLALRLGVDPFMLFQAMMVIHGKPGMEARLCIALANERGPFTGPIQYKFSGTKGQDDWTCTASAKHKKTGEVYELPVNWATVKAEGWLDKSGSKWKTMPEQMFRYRSASWLIRAYCPEVVLGIHTIDELEDAAPAPNYIKTEIVDATSEKPEQESKTPAQEKIDKNLERARAMGALDKDPPPDGELPLADRKVDKRKKPITPYQIEKLYSAIKGVKPSATPDDVVAYCERVVKGKIDSIESLYATDFDDIMAQVENDKDIRR